MKLNDQLYKITAAMGAVVLALGIGVGTNVLSVDAPPPIQKQDVIEDNADPLAPEPAGIIETAKFVYNDLSGVRQETSMLVPGVLQLPAGNRSTLYLEVDTSKTIDNKVEIVIPTGMKVLDYPTPDEMPALVSKLDLSQFGVEQLSGYTLQNGILTYYVTDAAPHLSLEFVVARDNAFWNGLEFQRIADPIKVRVYSGSGATAEEHDVVSINVNVVNSKNANYYVRHYGVAMGVPAASGRENHFKTRIMRVQMAGYSKELNVTMPLPKNTMTGKYAKYDTVEFPNYAQRTFGLDPSINTGCTLETSVDDTKHTVTFTWKNIYLEEYDYFVPYFYWEAGDEPVNNDVITFYSDKIPFVEKYGTEVTDSSGNVLCAIGGNRTLFDGTVIQFGNQYSYKSGSSDPIPDFTVLTKTFVSVNSRSRTEANMYATDPDLTYCFGSLRMRNYCGLPTEPRTVRFAYHNTDKFGVTAQNIPAVPGRTVTVRYKTSKHSDAYVEHPTALNAGTRYFVTFDAATAGLDPDEYFTEIEADVGVIPAGYLSYYELFTNEPWDGGTVFGKIIKSNVANGTYEIASCWWNNTNSETETGKEYICKVILKDATVTGLGLVPDMTSSGEAIPMYSKEVAFAGETVHVNALVSLAGNNHVGSMAHVIDDPIICLRLPAGVSVANVRLDRVVGSRADILYFSDGFENMRDMSGTPVSTPIASTDYEVSEPIAMAQDYTLRTITFKNGAGRIGWYDMANRSQTQIRLSYDMILDPAMPSSSISIRTTVFVRSASLGAYDGTDYQGRSKSEDLYGLTDLLASKGLIRQSSMPSLSLSSIGLMDDETSGSDNAGTGDGDEETPANPIYLASCASTYDNRNMIIKAARGGNLPTVSVGINGGTATVGTQALLMADANGDVTLPPAPVKEGKTFEGWVASDGRTYQAGETMHVGIDNVTIAAKWSDETAPVPDVLKPFEYTLNESGVNYGGTGGDMNADASGEVPAAIAQRAGGSTGKIAANDDENGDDNANGNTGQDPDDNATTLPPGDNYLDDPPDLDGEGPEDPNGNGDGTDDGTGNGSDDDNPNGRAGDGSDGDGTDGPNGTTGDGTNGNGQGDPTGGATRIGSGTGSGSGSASTISGGKGYDSGSPLASTSDNVPIAVILCTAGVALLLASLVLFRMQARARLAEAADITDATEDEA